MIDREFIKCSTESGIGIIQLNRPEVANALNRTMGKELLNKQKLFTGMRRFVSVLLKVMTKHLQQGLTLKKCWEIRRYRLSYWIHLRFGIDCRRSKSQSLLQSMVLR